MSTLTADLTLSAINARLRTIAAMVGPKATGLVMFHARGDHAVNIDPCGDVLAKGQKWFHGSDIPALLDQAEAWASTQGTIQRDAAIRRMALDLIDLKDQHGAVTARLLRTRKWSDGEIADLHEAACERAGEMAQGAPFAVVFGELVA